MVTHHSAIFGSHKHCGTGDIVGICLLNNGCYGNMKKDTLSVIVATDAKRIKYFIKNFNLLHSKYH